MRPLDADPAALRAYVARALPQADLDSIERTADGVSTPVYRVRQRNATFYLRLGETRHSSLGPEVVVHRLLLKQGAHVPEVVHYEPYDEALDRSAMITTAIPGLPLARSFREIDAGAVCVAAGRDLALINAVAVERFGWIRRDHGTDWEAVGPTAELSALRGFALADVDADLAALAGFLRSGEASAIRRTIDQHDGWLKAERALLAHGDFDATHIFHHRGVYTGIIDFGEMRGTDRFYDLGHFALHDSQHVPVPLLPHLIAGYADAMPMPADHRGRIAFWAVWIGLRFVARTLGRLPATDRESILAALRRQVAEVSG